MRTFTHRFDTCLYEVRGTRCISTFPDGTVNDYDFGWWIARGDNADLCGELGYGAMPLLYYWEHDFVHHFIADERGQGPSPAIYRNELDVPIRTASQDMRYEEWIVHCVQSWIREDDLSDCPLEAFEGWDSVDFMDRLRAALRDTFGEFFDMPSIVNRWHPSCVDSLFCHLQDSAYVQKLDVDISSMSWPAYHHMSSYHFVSANRVFYRMPAMRTA